MASYVAWLERSVEEAGLHWLSDEVQAVLWVQMRARDRLVQRMREAVRAADSATADAYALALLGEERNLQRVPGESLEVWRAYVMRAVQRWQEAGTVAMVRAQLARLGLGSVVVYEWGASDPSRWAEFSVFVFGAQVQPPAQWGEAQAWQDDGLWGWDGDADVVRALLSLIRKWKPAKSKLASLEFREGAVWGVDDGVWQEDGMWQEDGGEIVRLQF